MELEFEEKYKKELFAMESAIVSIYEDHPQMADYSVMEALDNLIRGYEAESNGRVASSRRMEPLDQQIYKKVGAICEMLMHRGKLVDEDGNDVSLSELSADELALVPPNFPAITLEEVLACLKRIRKSVTRWNKANGRRGYLDFVQEYL
jgi:hypothetical protein